MDRQNIIAQISENYSTEPEYPWDGELHAVFRHWDNKKWFALIMNIPRQRLGLPEDGNVDVMNLKCYPELIGSLRMTPGIFPAYHMNKEKWVSVLLDGTVPEETVFSLLDMSFELTRKKCANKKKTKE